MEQYLTATTKKTTTTKTTSVVKTVCRKNQGLFNEKMANIYYVLRTIKLVLKIVAFSIGVLIDSLANDFPKLKW